jgi:RND superfamily putative drug exporter
LTPIEEHPVPSPHSHIAARAGRWSAQHPKAAIFGWLAFVIAAVVIGGAVGTRTLTGSESGVGESGVAARAVSDAFPSKADETVIVQSAALKAGDPHFRTAVDDVVRRLQAVHGVSHVTRGEVSADRHSMLVDFQLDGDHDGTQAIVDRSLAAVGAAADAHPRLQIEEFGDASAEKGLQQSFADDLAKAEKTSLPLTLLILVVAFGALVAAGVPLLLAITGVVATISLVGPISHIAPVDAAISNVILLIGLAVGVDYSLFYLKRVREERAAGRGNQAAIEAAAATSGHAVLVSGFTVIIAMAGMYLAGDPGFTSFATGTIVVVAVSMLASLSVLPAVLSKLGDRVEMGRIPFAGRLQRRAREADLWSRLVDRVLRRPLLASLISGGMLVALALPALGMHTSLPGNESLSRDIPVVQTLDRIQAAFPSQSTPAAIVVEAADVTAAPVVAATQRFQAAAARRIDLFTGATSVSVSPDRSVAQISIPIAGSGTDAASERVLEALRGTLVPAAFGSVDGVKASVGGMTAQTADFNAGLRDHLPIVFGFVLGAAFLLLLVTFRSLVIPIKAILLNLLSVGAAYGVLVLVFQKGWGESLLGFESNGAVVAWLPLFLFVVLFGLSMDYHVFVLTRVREAYDGGMRTELAVAHAIKSTAGVVTSAAMVMVGVFAIFGSLSNLALKEMGVGLAVAILLDATIIRGVLLPATMKLLGDWNWWLPKSLGWLPEVAGETAPAPAA